MGKVFVLGLAAGLTTAVVLAQDHQNAAERIVKQSITLSADTSVGTQLLKAGDYRVSCDREAISFRDSNGKTVFTTKCQGAELSAPSDHNEIQTSDENGKHVLTKLLLKGSNVEHVFN
jgi:hypothetical protein